MNKESTIKTILMILRQLEEKDLKTILQFVRQFLS